MLCVLLHALFLMMYMYASHQCVCLVGGDLGVTTVCVLVIYMGGGISICECCFWWRSEASESPDRLIMSFTRHGC